MYWWFEDYQQLAERYDAVEAVAVESTNPYHLELLANLWAILHTAVLRGKLSSSDAKQDERLRVLTDKLELLSRDSRRTTALEAKATLLRVQLLMSPLSSVLRELQEVVEESKGLMAFPLEPLTQLIKELGEAIGGEAAYADLFESILTITAEREGEIAAARMLVTRGAQELNAGRPYDAIRFIGRALRRLYKNESRDDLVRALYLCAKGYERVGLLWAARGTAVTAAAVATELLHAYEEITPFQALCYEQVKWLELQLGRLPQALVWHETALAIKGVLNARGDWPKDRFDNDEKFDLILGSMLLKTDYSSLGKLSFVPSVLERLGLTWSATALYFALGHEKELSEPLNREGNGELETMFAHWRDQTNEDEMPPRLLLYNGPQVELSSRLLGCTIIVKAENRPPCVEVAETMLAAIEALLATGTGISVVAREPTLVIDIEQNESLASPFDFSIEAIQGFLHVHLRCAPFNPHNASRETQSNLKAKLLDLVSVLLAKAFLFGDGEESLQKLFENELALERALDFTGSIVTVGNVLGDTPKTTLRQWVAPDQPDFPLRRAEPWDSTQPTPRDQANLSSLAQSSKQNDSHTKSPDFGNVKHTEIRTVSLIREALWDRAGWSGTAFVYAPYPPGDPAFPPILAPLFTNGGAAREIFINWLGELGEHDVDERLRVSIIRGIDRKHPFAYRVVFGSNLDQAKEDAKLVVLLSRVNTMDASSDKNLNGFLSAYKASGRYRLVPAVVRDGGLVPVPNAPGIGKSSLYVREAWEIGMNDPDIVGLLPDDDPIIPRGRRKVPVYQVLRFLKNRRTHS